MEVTPPTSPIIAITGGTGSFGRAFTEHLLTRTAAHVRVISRDEHRQAAMRAAFPPSPRLTYILTDIRNTPALTAALDGASHVVHAAALKIVGMGEQHPDEFADVNVAGTHSVIRSALAAGVGRLLFVSTDKAVQPINLYGATKMTAERLVIHANKLGATRGLRAACIRGGNIWNSNGSVAKVWHAARQAGQPLVVNGPNTTRFHLVMPTWIEFAHRALTEMHGGEVFVPKAPAWNLAELANAFSGSPVFAGLRDGDKPEESLYSADEAARTVDAGWAYVVEPPAELRAVWDYVSWDGKPAPLRAYASGGARQMTPDELKLLVQETFK